MWQLAQGRKKMEGALKGKEAQVGADEHARSAHAPWWRSLVCENRPRVPVARFSVHYLDDVGRGWSPVALTPLLVYCAGELHGCRRLRGFPVRFGG
jgi:hypothetical protein